MSKPYCAFIFARGGSKGVKDKNIRPVAGKPLIAHTIETALSSKYIESVIVSTDSDKIASVSEEYGAQVLKRPDELAGDTASELLAWRHGIESCKGDLNSLFISLPATSPLRSVEDIDNAIEAFKGNEFDILFGVSASHRNPYLNMVTVGEDKLLDIVIPGSDAVRRQDVPEVYDVTTCVYVGNVNYLEKCEKLMEGRVGSVEIPVERSLDIDTEFDLYLADMMLRQPFESKES